MSPAGDLRVNGERLWQDLMAMAEIGATAGGGSGRLALTDLDRQARDLFVGWAEAAGCAVRIDTLGNIFARRRGTEAEAPPVIAGSHLDTQPLGGRFDGVYGVLAALEVLRTLDENGIETKAPLDAVCWTDEEGCRFETGMVASGVFAGKYDLDWALAITDPDGVTIGEALNEIGYAGTEPVGVVPVAAYLEAHIEQGPVLETEGKTIGVVLGAQARRVLRLEVEGTEGHAGTVPMDRRRDAALGAARMVDAINRIALDNMPGVITVADMRLRPNSRNTIAGRAVFVVDSRHPDGATLDAMRVAIESACGEIASASGLGLSIEEKDQSDAIAFDERCIATVRDAATALGFAHRDIHSGAGHDACNLALKVPTGMIFVPCEDGISHNETENAKPEDLEAGANVLLHAMLAWAE
jgi:N-carbamoyl-L-amino-acid hydrolase